MIFPYGLRLACLCLQMIFLVNLAASAIVLCLSRRAASAANTMPPHRAARLLFILRLLPFVLTLSMLALLCIPSYLRYEPNFGSERVGWFCLLTSALGLGLCAELVSKGLRILAQLRRLERGCRLLPPLESGEEADMRLCLAQDDGSGAPLLALVGLRQPRLIVSRRILETLSAEQFEAALSHERAHRLSRDNLKRLLLMLAPGILPFLRGFGDLQRRWEHYAELAADDFSTSGRLDRSIALAEALVQVARLGNCDRRLPLASSLSARDVDLAMRVKRLLDPASVMPPQSSRPKLCGNSWAVFAACATCLALLPEALHPLYRLLESLLH